MKILAIDDQQLVLMPLEKRLKEQGYEVVTTTDVEEGIQFFMKFKPDLLILDINMPQTSGLDVIRYIRKGLLDKTPIVVLSGDRNQDSLIEAFELGISDFMKKPLSLDEVCIRVKSILGSETRGTTKDIKNTTLQSRCVGVVIPCYNEEKRLKSASLLEFIDKNAGYHLCFVNDGSTDNTLEVLNNLRVGRENSISIFNCVKNGGKAEAVRQGLKYMANMPDLDYVGFLDADLSTDLQDFDDLVNTLETSDFKIVNGSRISRMGANITKESARKLISMTINLIICKILGMPFRDTQCGAKIMRKELISVAFNRPFYTKWLFDVEVFMRMKIYYGKQNVQKFICEQPLKRWIHEDGSKLSMKDSMKIGIQLIEIYLKYTLKRSLYIAKNNTYNKVTV